MATVIRRKVLGIARALLVALPLLAILAIPRPGVAQPDAILRPNSPLAEQYWKGVLDRSPRNAQAHFSLGEYYNLTYRYQDSALHYHKAALIRPGWAEAHFRLGTTYRELGRQAEAAASFQQAALLDPTSARAHHFLGMALLSLGRMDKAGASLHRAYLVDPGWAENYYENVSAIHSEFNDQETVLDLARIVYPVNQRLARLLYNRWARQNSAMDDFYSLVVNPAPLDGLKAARYRRTY
jgi:tetratricopeptide (TPR) repeat protein